MYFLSIGTLYELEQHEYCTHLKSTLFFVAKLPFAYTKLMGIMLASPGATYGIRINLQEDGSAVNGLVGISNSLSSSTIDDRKEFM